jgi:fatty acid desaturase/membrane-associated phospholipid phosphatase
MTLAAFHRAGLAQSTNVLVMASIVAMCSACLWLASHATAPLLFLAAAAAFGLLNNTMFSLMHEAVHGLFHRNRMVNEVAGNLAAAFFPTVFVIQRLSHLTHHKNNRSTVERFDYYGPGDYHILKVAQWYSLLTGLYWLFIPVFATVYAVLGNLVPWKRLIATDGTLGRQTSAKPYFDALQLIPMWQVRAGLLLTIAVQLLLFWALDLTFWRWAACYAVFGLMWSSLQYADHAYSALDVLEGAWNLRVNRFIRLIYLNYHFHQCHHRDTTISWRSLPGAARPDDPTFAFSDMLYFMWSGPRLVPGAHLTPDTLRRNDMTVCIFLAAIFMCFFALIYGVGDYLHRAADTTRDLSIGIDHMIPFIPQFAVIYLLVSPLLAAAPFVMKSPERSLPFGVALTAELIVALAIYYAFPTSIRPVSYDPNGLFGSLMSLADWINLDGNNLPSLHVALVVSAAWAYAPYLSPRVRFAVFILAALIVASTLLLHQHVLVDVVSGMALAAFGMGVVHPLADRKLQEIKKQLGAAVANGR